MADLEDADFSRARISRARFRSAILRNAQFNDARLTSVCLEKADLLGADFTGVDMQLMENWGEPNYDGAKIEDAVRYRYAIISSPMEALQFALVGLILDEAERRDASAFFAKAKKIIGEFAEVMVIFDDYSDVINIDLFAQIMKRAKSYCQGDDSC